MNIKKIIQNRMNEISKEAELVHEFDAHHDLMVAYAELEQIIPKIDTPVFNLTMHRIMWGIIAELGGNEYYAKDTALRIIGAKNVLGDCFACDYVSRLDNCKQDKNICKDYCPFKVSAKIPEHSSYFNIDHCLNGLYRQWIDAKDTDTARDIARNIRDLEAREGVEVK